MVTPDFDFEFHSDEIQVDPSLREEAEQRIRALTEGHKDIIGASVAVERQAHGETPHLIRARVVVYIRPENLAAVEKADSVMGALKGALDAVERQVRERRARLRERDR